MKHCLAPVLLLIALLTACNSSNRVIGTGLSVELTAIAPQPDGTVKINWHIANTNIVSYLLSRVQQKIVLDGVYLGTIDDREPLAVPAATNAGHTAIITPSPAAAKLLQDSGPASVAYHVDTKITILIYGENIESSKLSNAGTVAITR